ncbi:MAG: hypothetical protein M1820_002074 [Bogoriella megaspora]|nr:MAG: hypothetical protein M1820_002074 [Bogoriella megaspora]
MCKFLIENGADIDEIAKDETGGSRTPLGVIPGDRSNGADIDAVDDFGRSVTDMAYQSVYDYPNWGGGYRGDLWDAALLQCGYDVYERRLHHARTPQYDGMYRREDFERLWEGREELCPYFDDPPHWPPGGCVVPLSAKEDNTEEEDEVEEDDKSEDEADIEEEDKMEAFDKESEYDVNELLDDYMT